MTVLRPYASHRLGEEVADVDGRARRFDGPWDWTAFDGEPAGTGPERPLVLLTRAGTLCSVEDAEAVAVSTASGSRQKAVRDWMSLTNALPAP